MNFRGFLENIDKDYESKLSKYLSLIDIKSTLNTEMSLVKGEEYFTITSSISNDFNVDTEAGFKEIMRKKEKEAEAKGLKRESRKNLTSIKNLLNNL